MAFDILIGIGGPLISSITTIIVVLLICLKIESFSLMVRTRKPRTRRQQPEKVEQVESWRDLV